MWKKVICLVVAFLFLYPTIQGYTHQSGDKRDIAVIIVPGLSFNEVPMLLNSDTYHQLWQDAAIGAMNVRPDGPYSYLNNMVTLSAGSKAVGVQGWNSFERGEKVNGQNVENWMLQTTGTVPKTGLLHPEFHRLIEKNKETTHLAPVGKFGELLGESRITRRALGHSDTAEEQVRYGSLLTMNHEGKSEGAIQQATKSSRNSAYGIEMDAEFLIHTLSTTVDDSRFTVIEWGDFYRLYEQKPHMVEEQFERQFEKQVVRLNQFLASVRKEVGTVWLLSPIMHKEAYEQRQQLAPVFYWEKGQTGGYLTSETTRQDYLVSSLDFIPTILQSYSIPIDKNWAGKPMVRSNPGSTDKSPVLDEVNEMVLIFKSRAGVLSTYITSLVVALVGAAIFGWLGVKRRETWRRINRVILLSALMSPFWFLALSQAVAYLGITGFVITFITTSFVSGFIIERATKSPVIIVGWLTFLLITIDIICGSPLMQRSFLGYDPIIGARYYGIGNEYVGVYLVAAFIMLTPFLKQTRNKIVSTIVIAGMGMLLLVMLGKSNLGTNAGATLSAGIAICFLLIRFYQLKFTWKMIVWVIGAGVGMLSVLFLLQMTGEKTHIGAAFDRLLAGDFVYISNIIERKIAMNMKIFQHSNWTQLFVTSYLLVSIILWRRRLHLKDTEKQLFLQTGVVASFALLVLNDSGVVAGATSMFCVVSTHYYWLSLKKEGH